MRGCPAATYITFVDDTKLINRSVQDLTGLLHLFECRAAEYYLEVAASNVKTWNRKLVPVVSSQVHLVSLVTNDQQISKELGGRLSIVGANVKKLQNCWKHSTTAWKLISFFNTDITSQVPIVYILPQWLLKVDLKRLDTAQTQW